MDREGVEKVIPIFARALCRRELSVSVANRDFVLIAHKYGSEDGGMDRKGLEEVVVSLRGV